MPPHQTLSTPRLPLEGSAEEGRLKKGNSYTLELCAVAALTVLQRLEELRLHIGAALNVGATKEEVAEVIFQMMTYGGVPTTVEGLKICKAVLEERRLWQET